VRRRGFFADSTFRLLGPQTGMTPLHKACQYGHARAVEELIKEGADVLALNDVSISPPPFLRHATALVRCHARAHGVVFSPSHSIFLSLSQWNSTPLHWLVKGFVHNQKVGLSLSLPLHPMITVCAPSHAEPPQDKAFMPDDYLKIATLLYAESKKVLDKQDAVRLVRVGRAQGFTAGVRGVWIIILAFMGVKQRA
jgi:hypothetical protein